MNITDIGQKLRQVKNLTEFAKRCKVSRRTLIRMRQGWNNPTYETLRKIEAQLAKDEKK